MHYHTYSKPYRQFLPQKFNPFHKKELNEIIANLINNPPYDFKSARIWFGTFHELSCAVSEAQTILELNINLHNKDKKHEKELEEFEKNILSGLLLCREKMMDIYLNSPFKYSMHAFDNDRIGKELYARKKFSIPELSALQIEENKIVREYKKFVNLSTTYFNNQDILVSSLLGKTHDLNKKIRKDAFSTYWHFIKKNEEQYQLLFDRLLENRRAQASIVGCKNYTEVAFAELGRFDYGEAECSILRNSILKVVVPLVTELSKQQAESLNEKTIKPWDNSVWPGLMPGNTPAISSMQQFIVSIENIMGKIHPSFGALFREMQEKNLIDVSPKLGKSPGAFSVTLQESKVPFLFGNFGTNLRDTFTFIHEFGHCLHSYAVTNIDNILLRHPGFEFCEFASIGLELLSTKFFNELWLNSQDVQNALKYQLFQMLQFWPFMAMVDEWQHELYSSHNFLTKQERNKLWLQISKKYKPHLDWRECENFEELGWLSRQHIYTSPFYFIDYGIAQIGALQLWILSKQNYSLAVEKYIRGLSLGAQLSLQGLYQETGIKFDFSEELMDTLCEEILKEINKK